MNGSYWRKADIQPAANRPSRFADWVTINLKAARDLELHVDAPKIENVRIIDGVAGTNNRE